MSRCVDFCPVVCQKRSCTQGTYPGGERYNLWKVETKGWSFSLLESREYSQPLAPVSEDQQNWEPVCEVRKMVGGLVKYPGGFQGGDMDCPHTQRRLWFTVANEGKMSNEPNS